MGKYCVRLLFKTHDPSFAPLYEKICSWVLDNFDSNNNSEVSFSAKMIPDHENIHGWNNIIHTVVRRVEFELDIAFCTEESYNLFRLMFAGTGYDRHIRTIWTGSGDDWFTAQDLLYP